MSLRLSGCNEDEQTKGFEKGTVPVVEIYPLLKAIPLARGREN